jgi:hypothetical protein
MAASIIVVVSSSSLTAWRASIANCKACFLLKVFLCFFFKTSRAAVSFAPIAVAKQLKIAPPGSIKYRKVSSS